MGKNHDSQLLEWTKSISQAAEARLCAENLKEELQGLNYLPSQPSLENFVEHILGTSSNEAKESTSKGHMHDATVQDITTVDTSVLNLCFSYQPGDTVTSVCNNIKTGGISDNTLQETIKAVSEAAASKDKNDLKSAIDSVLHQDQPKGYQIIGDNVDLHISVRHMSEQNKNKSLHTFNLVAMRDVVSGRNLPNNHIRTLNDVEISEFLPCHNDVENLKKDFIVLWARVMVKNIPAFSFLKGVVIQHIQHQYSKEMQAVTEEVPLGCLPKNETLNEDMVDILETLQEKYVPMVQNGGESVPADIVFFGGDQLTEERVRNIQRPGWMEIQFKRDWRECGQKTRTGMELELPIRLLQRFYASPPL